MKKANAILMVAVAGLLGWSGMETYNLMVAQRQVSASRQLSERMDRQLALARAKASEAVAKVDQAESNRSSGTTKAQ